MSFAVQIKWLISTQNATRGWNELNQFRSRVKEKHSGGKKLQRKGNVDLDILVTTKNVDWKIMQPMRLTRRLPMIIRKWNQFSRFRWTSSKVAPVNRFRLTTYETGSGCPHFHDEPRKKEDLYRRLNKSINNFSIWLFISYLSFNWLFRAIFFIVKYLLIES